MFCGVFKFIFVDLVEKNSKLKVDINNIDNCKEYKEQCETILDIACNVYGIEEKEEDEENDKNDKKSNENDMKEEKKCVTADCAKLDPTHKFQGRVYYANKSIENVYNGGVKWDTDLDYFGYDYYGLDCGENVLAYGGGTGYKYRDPAVGCYLVGDDSQKLTSLTFGEDNLCKFKENCPSACFVDDIHDICWYSNGKLIKGLTINYAQDDIGDGDGDGVNDENMDQSNSETVKTDQELGDAGADKNDVGNDDDEDEDEDEEEEGDYATYDYRLNGNGMIVATNDQILSLDGGDLLYSWNYDNLETRKKSGQSADVTHRIKLVNDRLNIKSGFWRGAGLSYCGVDTNDLLVTYDNGMYLYDLNKQCVRDIFLGGRYAVNAPRRQHLYAENRSIIMGYSWHCVKLYDTRMDNTKNDNNININSVSKVSVNGSGDAKLTAAMGFNINGHSFIATGGSDEAITIWDLRYVMNGNSGALYELSTGNCNVTELAWHKSSQTIFAITECEYVDRLGYKYYGHDQMCRDEGDSDSNDDDSGNGDGGSWPKGAVHPKGFFKNNYDAGHNSLYSYSFSSQ